MDPFASRFVDNGGNLKSGSGCFDFVTERIEFWTVDLRR